MKSIVGTIDRVAFSFGPFTVYWYGIIIGAAMLLAITLASKEGKKEAWAKRTLQIWQCGLSPLDLSEQEFITFFFNGSIISRNRLKSSPFGKAASRFMAV